MPIQSELLSAAANEWKRWGFSSAPIHDPKRIGGRESEQPFVHFANDYWVTVDEPTRNGNSPYPWSAAFVSFCFKTAAAGTGFPYSGSHWGYCAAIVSKPNTYSKLKLMDPASSTLQAGDLLWAARGGSNCPKPPVSAATATGSAPNGRAASSSRRPPGTALRSAPPPSVPSPAEATFNQAHNPMVGAVLHDAKGAVPDGV
ncbi:uncharacterized protein DUF2272 [Bradyrhizobium macuxiense]|uniref:Uncharacterized protein DUF2272 n=1 Tax=Bradyrhizobium macuxiense TaxID=1755647 RepID=A0A560KXI6_9BRAD|nr:uncharacterized protein DUF2272 [Bradyrhizobium macuxiense]